MRILLLTIVFFSKISYAGFGSFGFTATRFTTQGGAGVANSDRIFSLGLNPAGTIILSDSTFMQFNFAIPNIGIGYNNSAFSGSDISEYINSENGSSKILTEKDEKDIIDLIDDGTEFLFQTRANILRFGWMENRKIGAFTFSIDDNILIRTNLPRDLVSLAFKGNEIGREYIFDDFSYQAAHVRSYSLNYARNLFVATENNIIKILNIGIGVKLLNGFGYSDFTTSKARLFTDNNAKISLEIIGIGKTASGNEISNFINNEATNIDTPFPESAGFGYGLDLGAVAELQNGLLLGFALTDLGKINFNDNVEVNNQSLVNIIEEVTDSEIDSLESGFVNTSTGANEFDVSLPSALRIGVTIPAQKFIPIIGSLTASLDYFQGFNDNFANSTTPRVAVGAEWLPFDYLPSILLGISNDRFGAIRTTLGFGYSLRVFDIYLGTRDFISTISGGRRASFSFNIRWKIW